MAGFILDAGVTITCPHGGRVQVIPRSTRVSLGGKPALLVDDTATIAACPFTVSGTPSPCLRVEWTMPATRVKVQSSPVLLSTSIGLCVNAANVPQGTALVNGFQSKVQAR
jgi:hypothetical protein